ncbi:unnamed protein product, partial [Iphiclides podalirius]
MPRFFEALAGGIVGRARRETAIFPRNGRLLDLVTAATASHCSRGVVAALQSCGRCESANADIATVCRGLAFADPRRPWTVPTFARRYSPAQNPRLRNRRSEIEFTRQWRGRASAAADDGATPSCLAGISGTLCYGARYITGPLSCAQRDRIVGKRNPLVNR